MRLVRGGEGGGGLLRLALDPFRVDMKIAKPIIFDHVNYLKNTAKLLNTVTGLCNAIVLSLHTIYQIFIKFKMLLYIRCINIVLYNLNLGELGGQYIYNFSYEGFNFLSTLYLTFKEPI